MRLFDHLSLILKYNGNHNKVAKQLEHHFVKSILQGHYKPGETLIAETFLALELNVNRCYLRTVLKILEKDGGCN